MTTAPLGSLSLALDSVRELAAASATFQAARSVETSELAKPHIHLDWVDEFAEEDGLEAMRPYIVVAEDGHGYDQQGEGVGIDLAGGGIVVVAIYATAECPENHSESKLIFTNLAGQIIDEMADNSGESYDDGNACHFPARSIQLLQRAVRSNKTERSNGNDFWWAAWSLEWGAEA